MDKIKKMLRIMKEQGQRILYLGLTLCAAFGWWGVLYPQFALNKDTYRIVSEDGTVQGVEDVVEWESGDTIYMELLNADAGQIRFRSKLLENALNLWEAFCGK